MDISILKVDIPKTLPSKEISLYVLHQQGETDSPILGVSQIIIIDDEATADYKSKIYDFLKKSSSNIETLYVFCHLGYNSEHKEDNKEFEAEIFSKFSQKTQSKFPQPINNHTYAVENFFKKVDEYLSQKEYSTETFEALQNEFVKLFIPHKNEIDYLHYLHENIENIEHVVLDNLFYKQMDETFQEKIKDIYIQKHESANDLLSKIRDVIIS